MSDGDDRGYDGDDGVVEEMIVVMMVMMMDTDGAACG